MCHQLRKVLSVDGVEYVRANIQAIRSLRTLEHVRAYLNGWEIEVTSTEPPAEDAREEDAA